MTFRESKIFTTYHSSIGKISANISLMVSYHPKSNQKISIQSAPVAPPPNTVAKVVPNLSVLSPTFPVFSEEALSHPVHTAFLIYTGEKHASRISEISIAINLTRSMKIIYYIL